MMDGEQLIMTIAKNKETYREEAKRAFELFCGYYQEQVRAGVLPSDFNFDEIKQLVAMQPGDVSVTYADSTALKRDFGFTPRITLRKGLRKFAEWYKEYYH